MFKKWINYFNPRLKKEISETKFLFKFLFKGGSKEEKKFAIKQSKDILKGIFIGIVFMIPFIGGLSSAFLIKKFPYIRPDSFQQ
jgi:hypothetical protein